MQHLLAASILATNSNMPIKNCKNYKTCAACGDPLRKGKNNHNCSREQHRLPKGRCKTCTEKKRFPDPNNESASALPFDCISVIVEYLNLHEAWQVMATNRAFWHATQIKFRRLGLQPSEYTLDVKKLSLLRRAICLNKLNKNPKHSALFTFYIDYDALKNAPVLCTPIIDRDQMYITKKQISETLTRIDKELVYTTYAFDEIVALPTGHIAIGSDCFQFWSLHCDRTQVCFVRDDQVTKHRLEKYHRHEKLKKAMENINTETANLVRYLTDLLEYRYDQTQCVWFEGDVLMIEPDIEPDKEMHLSWIKGDPWNSYSGKVKIKNMIIEESDNEKWGDVHCYNWMKEKYGEESVSELKWTRKSRQNERRCVS